MRDLKAKSMFETDVMPTYCVSLESSSAVKGSRLDRRLTEAYPFLRKLISSLGNVNCSPTLHTTILFCKCVWHESTLPSPLILR